MHLLLFLLWRLPESWRNDDDNADSRNISKQLDIRQHGVVFVGISIYPSHQQVARSQWIFWSPVIRSGSLFMDSRRLCWIVKNSLQGVNKEPDAIQTLPRGFSKCSCTGDTLKRGRLIRTENKDHSAVMLSHTHQRNADDTTKPCLVPWGKSHTIEYSLRPTAEGMLMKGTLSLNTAEFAENELRSKVIETENGHKIGYYVYNFFCHRPNIKQYAIQWRWMLYFQT